MKYLRKIAEEDWSNKFETKEDIDNRERYIDHIIRENNEDSENEYRKFESETGNQKIISDFQSKVNDLKEALSLDDSEDDKDKNKAIKEALFQISELCKEYTYLLED